LTTVVQAPRNTTNAAPPTLKPGVLYTELGTTTRLWVGASGGNRLLLSSMPSDAPLGGNYLPLNGGTVTGTTRFRNPVDTSNQITITPWSSTNAFTPDTAMLDGYYQTSASGGASGGVVSVGRFYTSITGAPNTFLWSVLGVVDYNGTGGNGQHVALYGQGIRRKQNSGGTTNNPEVWAATLQTVDFTNTDSALTNSLTTLEIDMNVGNTDSAHQRSLITMALNKANDADASPTCHTGIGIYTDNIASTFDSILRLWAPYNDAVLDFRSANEKAGATIWFGDNASSIQWNGTGSVRTHYSSAALSGAGAVVHNGNVEIDGTLYVPNQIIIGAQATLSGGASCNGDVLLNGHVLNWSGSHTTAWDSTIFGGTGGVLHNSSEQINGTLYVPNQIITGAQADLNGGASCGGDVLLNGHALNWSGSHITSWDATVLSGAGGVRHNSNVQVDGTLYAPNGTVVGGSSTLNIVQVNGHVGFNNTAPIAKPTIVGAKGGNSALASLLSALAQYGLVTDASST
jgi:hypothetical protein